ncbi:MAG: hypothetical protein EAZ12_03345 [Sphingobacteriia bacterium]|nr:MAG: hypothetical protein EAZ12_03345 [Sphingobacteriia bacterium]
MKKYLIFIFVLLSFAFQAQPTKFTVTPSTTDKEIVEMEKNIEKTFYKIVKIQVVKRKEQTKLIEHLVCREFNTNGREVTNCSSDNFGELIIENGSISISDKKNLN